MNKTKDVLRDFISNLPQFWYIITCIKPTSSQYYPIPFDPVDVRVATTTTKDLQTIQNTEAHP